MKAEETIVAFMFFSVVMQFVYFIGKKEQQNLGGGGVERDKSRGTGGPNSSGRYQGTPVKIIDGGLVS